MRGEKEWGSRSKHDPLELGLETDGLNMEKVTNIAEKQLIKTFYSTHLKTAREEQCNVNCAFDVMAIIVARVLLTKLLFAVVYCTWWELLQPT